VLLELAPQEVGVGRLPAEAVAVLRQDHGHAPGGHEVPNAVHAGPLKACAPLSGVLYLLEYLVALSGSVGSQSFELLG
jgi:hypothetical protein